MMYRYQIAPMMGYTHSHFRILMRILSNSKVLSYTEMVTTGAVCYGDPHKYLAKKAEEGDVILQIGGSDLSQVAKTIQLANEYDYVGYNLNVGCPSDRVQNAKIGACLMKEPTLVAQILAVMKDNTDKPVSIKTRLGIDGVDSYDFFKAFVDEVSEVSHQWIVHARDAWLKGLSPRQNRSVPPLRYEYVYRLKEEMPHLEVSLNGGLKDLESIQEALLKVDSVMLGRVAYQNPRLIHALGENPRCYYRCLLAYIEYIRLHITEENVRFILAPLVMAISDYHGAKQDRTMLAACKEKALALQCLDQLEISLSNLLS